MTQIRQNYSSYNNHKNIVNFRSEQQQYPYAEQQMQPQNFLMQGLQIPQEAPIEQPLITPESQLPAMYQNPYNAPEPKTFKEKIKPYDFFGAITPWFDHPLLMAGTTIGTFWGYNKFTNAWSGKYEESLLGKATKFGDNISNSKFIQKEGVQKFLNFFKTGTKKIGEQLNKIQIVRAFKETPCKPEWPMGRIEMISQDVRIIHEDFGSIVHQLNLMSKDDIPLKNIGLKKEEETVLKRIFNTQNLKEVPESKKTIVALLKRIGESDEEALRVANLNKDNFSTVKSKICNAMGKDLTAEKLQKIIKDESGEFVDEVLEMARKTNGKIWVSEGEYKLFGNFFKRFVGMDNVFNRIHSLRVGEGAQTNLGKLMSQFIQKIYRGFTFGGGKPGMLIFIVPHIAHAITNTVKAERDEKIGTAVQNGIGVISWVFTMPLATQLIYKLGGIKNAGMGKEKVEEVEKLKKLYHEGDFEGNLKDLKTKIKKLKKVENQNFITKMARKIANFFTCDLSTIKPIASENLFVKLRVRLGNLLKNAYNVPLRFIAVTGMMIALDGVINKTLSAIFGRSHDEMDVEAHKEEKKAQKQFTKDNLQERLIEANQAKIANNKAIQQLNIRNANQEQHIIDPKQLATMKNETNFHGKTLTHKASPVDNYNYMPKQNTNINLNQAKEDYDNYTYIPSQETVLNTQIKEEKLNKYIPSQEPVKVSNTFDNSGLQDALKRADRAEKIALETLNGNFKNML